MRGRQLVGQIIRHGVFHLGRKVGRVHRRAAAPQRAARRRPGGPQAVRLGRHHRAALHRRLHVAPADQHLDRRQEHVVHLRGLPLGLFVHHERVRVVLVLVHRRFPRSAWRVGLY
ncbi:hypothetical protein [Hydrogenophaga sp. H7]|uniref:hypothetical protein n=1 Tax=Hydrogenophaga sp. H7 TaxID=1882399 RepID=UPI0015C470C2